MIYFDTDAFRGIGRSLGGSPLPDEIRRGIAISPITASEVLSQLSITDAGKILDSIKTTKQWLPQRAPILDWPDGFILMCIFGKSGSDEALKTVGKSLNVCLEADSPDEVKDSARALKDLLDRVKLQQAQRDQEVVERLRGQTVDWSQDATFFATGVANKVGVTLERGAEKRVSELLSAYFEYSGTILRKALANPNYNFLKHQNSALDAEQLVYLADPTLHFLTMDTGFECIQGSEQRKRIHILEAADLTDAAVLTHRLTKIAG